MSGTFTALTDNSAERHLRLVYPILGDVFDAVGPVDLPKPFAGTVADAVVRVVVGQMLSRKAAQSIRGRVVAASEELSMVPWRLPETVLRSCGLSGAKIKTIHAFGADYDKDPVAIEAWRCLAYPDLCRAVGGFWGLSRWTSSMLAIFYFGHDDVFPATDGTILRAVGLIEKHLLDGKSFDSAPASPFGTHLAMTLWNSVDNGFWRRFAEAAKSTVESGERTR